MSSWAMGKRAQVSSLWEPDAAFGPKTEQKVKDFQKFGADGPLAVDGIVGPATWTKLLTMWLSGNEPG